MAAAAMLTAQGLRQVLLPAPRGCTCMSRAPAQLLARGLEDWCRTQLPASWESGLLVGCSVSQVWWPWPTQPSRDAWRATAAHGADLVPKALVPRRTVGGLGGAGLSRRRHSTSDAVSAVHMHNVQMPRPRSQRVPRDGPGGNGRQLKLGLPRPQALAMGAAVVPLDEAGQVGRH